MITQALCNSYKQEILRGLHQETDSYWMALYDDQAMLSKATTVYTALHEVVGAGYSAGGQALVGFNVTLDLDSACLDWTADPRWPQATITARGALIYNASRGNRAVAVFDFGVNVTSVDTTFVVPLPAPTAGAAVLRIK